MKPNAFTLIELLVTFALMLVLYVMLYGSWSRNYQEKQKLACEKNLQLIQVALQIYSQDHAGRWPLVPHAATAEIPLSLLVPQYTAATQIFICPGSTDRKLSEAQPFGERTISYAYYMGHQATDSTNSVLLSDRQVDAAPKVEKQLVFSPDGKPPGANHHKFGGCFLFADGHTEQSPAYSTRDLPCPSPVVLLNPRPAP